MFPIRVLLVDDSPVFARASRHFFASLDIVSVVGRAICGEQAVGQRTEGADPGAAQYVDLSAGRAAAGASMFVTGV